MEVLSFWLFSAIAIGSALLCITRKNAVTSALFLVMTLFSLAALFVLLEAQFIAALQVLVYAGAIMVLFLFVIMLLNLGRRGPSDLPGWMGHAIMIGVGAVLVAELWAATRIVPPGGLRLPAGELSRVTQQEGAVRMISEPLFRDYLIPFEVTSVLLLAAIVGAVVLAKRRI